MGYKNVRDYEGGKSDWMEAGLPIEGDDSESQAGSDLAALSTGRLALAAASSGS